MLAGAAHRTIGFRLLVLLGGLALLGSLGAHLVTRRPFRTSPELGGASPPPRADPGAGLTIRPQPGELPRTLYTRTAVTPPLTRTTNLLLAGIDTRPELTGGRTDALVLVVLDRRSGHVGLVGIPRDLAVELPGEGLVRINTIYLRGTRTGADGKSCGECGVALLQQTMLQTFGLAVEHTLFVDHAGFEQLVDQLGGMAVNVVCPIRDRFIDPRGPDGRLELRLEAGVQWLDGRTALMFARSRHGRGIVDRARRQQAVLVGMRDRLLQLGPHRMAELLPALRRTVFTDMRSLDLLRLSRQLLRIRREQIHGLVLDWRHAEPTTLKDGRWVMIPRPAAIHDALSRLFEAGPPGDRRAETCKPMDAALH